MKRAFTLVELLIVIIVIAVIAAIAVPQFATSAQRSKDRALRQQLRIVRSAIDAFYADTGFQPEDLTDLGKTPAEFAADGGNGLNSSGQSVQVPAGRYHGPYLDRNGCIYTNGQYARGGTTPGKWFVPLDPVSGTQLKCTWDDRRTKANASATGRDSEGRLYSSY